MTGPIAILAGGGDLPALVEESVVRSGRDPLVIAIAGEADPASFASRSVHELRWGELGRLFRLLEVAGCAEAVFIGAIHRRPDFRAVRPDFGAVALLPRILKLMRNGDDSLLTGVAGIFAERGIRLCSPLDVAPDLGLQLGIQAGAPTSEQLVDVAKAAEAARMIGRLDIGQGAVAVGRRVVALEGAEGTDGLLERIALMRQRGRIPQQGGVLVKCMKPQQDARLDIPTIGPETAEKARAAGLDGVASEAGRTLVAGQARTLEAFRRYGLFLVGIEPPTGADRG